MVQSTSQPTLGKVASESHIQQMFSQNKSSENAVNMHSKPMAGHHSRALSNNVRQVSESNRFSAASLIDSPDDKLGIKSSSQVTAETNTASKFSVSEGTSSPQFASDPNLDLRPGSSQSDAQDKGTLAASFVSSNQSH